MTDLIPYSTESNDYFAAKYIARASKFYKEKMLQLASEKELRATSVPNIPLPHHMAYKLDPLYSKDGHRMYEFLIEYEIDKPTVGIYYGCRGITLAGYNHTQETDIFDKEWTTVQSELCTILNNTFPHKDFSYRFLLTDNGEDETYWPFWIRLNEDEDIHQVGLRAIRIIRSVYERMINGNIPNQTPMPKKRGTDQVRFTHDDYRQLLNQIKYSGNPAEDEQKTKEAQQLFEYFLKECCNRNYLMKNNNYESAWQFLIPKVDAARLILAWFRYMEKNLLFHPQGNTYTFQVPWTPISHVFLNSDGLAFNETHLRNYANRSDDDLDGEKLRKWEALISKIMEKIRFDLE